MFRSTDGGADLAEGALQGREHRRRRPGVRSREPADDLRRAVGRAAGAVGERRVVNGPGSGLFKSTDGGDTWQQLTKRTADGRRRARPHRHRRRAERPAAHVRAGGARETAASIAPTTPAKTGSASTTKRASGAAAPISPRSGSIRRIRTSSTSPTPRPTAPTDGGADVHRHQRRARRRRLPHHLDQPRQSQTSSCSPAIRAPRSRSTAAQTWSSWYNQPTAQFYHVITDNRFPYWVYGGQQESGSAGVASRGDDGEITFRDWHPVGVEEYGYVAPDPLIPNIIYGGKVTRFDQTHRPGAERRAGACARRQVPLPAHHARCCFRRSIRTCCISARNVLFKTMNGGHCWEVISPDLTRETYEVPPSVGIFTARRPGEAARIAA